MKLSAVYAAFVAFNVLFCVAFYASQRVPIISLSLHPQINECGGLHTFADVEFLKLFLVQVALSMLLQVSGVWWMTNSLRHLKPFWTLPLLVVAPFLIALIVMKLEPLFVECVK
ncbi:hypothetical protein [Rhizobium sp. MHM7A]|uniref:hypothetical protein n=1 Tax=Rhizobium sp. MHM7A TaxID=2583233 RepID=UPI001486A187|nr:hypothetical protein [Rhizobium sp. MHM7A]